MQIHSHEIRVFGSDKPLHLDLHKLRERIGARAGTTMMPPCATQLDDGAVLGGGEEAEEALHHEECDFDFDSPIQ